MAIIIDGKELAKKIRANLKIECEELKQKNINSKLAVIMVGEDPASKVYFSSIIFFLSLTSFAHRHPKFFSKI